MLRLNLKQEWLSQVIMFLEDASCTRVWCCAGSWTPMTMLS